MISLKHKARDHAKRHGPKCVNCEQEAYDESKTKEKLCVNCLRKLTRSSCSCCQKSFHVLTKSTNLPRSQQMCEGCTTDRQMFGEPKRCKICENPSAFEGPTCRTCARSEKSFGPPVPCEQCTKTCAFKLNEKSRAKVGGRTLCYICTQRAKLELKKESKAGRKHTDIMKQLRAPGPNKEHKPFSKAVLLEPVAMSTTTEDAHWEVLTEKFEILQRTFLEHKEQSETQIQQYIRKIFELRKELAEAQEAKERAVSKMHEKEREVGTLTGTVKQLENMAAFSLDQAKTARIELEQKHAREVADLNKQLKFLEYVTPQKILHEAKLTEEKASSTIAKGPDSFFGAPLALGSGAEPPRPKRVRPTPTEKSTEETEEKGKGKKKKGAAKADPESGEATPKTKLSKEDKKLKKADKKERKRLKKEAKQKKLEGVPEGNEEEEAVEAETGGEAADEAAASVESTAGDDQERSKSGVDDVAEVEQDPPARASEQLPDDTAAEGSEA